MGNVIDAYVCQGRAKTTPLYQYDYGQKLRFFRVELPEAYEVHFSTSTSSKTSYTAIGDESGVLIPDEILREPGISFAWVFLHTGESDGETKIIVEIPVIERAGITDTEPTPAQQDAISEAIEALNDAVENCEENVKKYPKIQNGNWFVWDAENDEWVDTGVHASGDITAFIDDTTTASDLVWSSLKTDNTKADKEDTVLYSSLTMGSRDSGSTTGLYSVAIGSGLTASGANSHAEGAGTKAIGESSHAEGAGTTAQSDYSHAEGIEARANGTGAHAEGYRTTATNYAHAEGNNTSAYGNYSHTEGYGAHTNSQYSHAEGYQSSAEGGPYNHAEGYHSDAHGTAAHSEGNGTTAVGNFSHTEGEQTITQSDATGSHAEGYKTRTNLPYSHAEGKETYANGYCSHAEGEQTSATGAYSHAEGQNTNSSGEGSHAEGLSSRSIGNNSHAEGSSTANGTASHSEGSGTTASGEWSHAEGRLTYAYGTGSHAEGSGTYANGNTSHAEGIYTIANGEAQHVFGKYNVEDNQGIYVEIVGNGTYNRSNARTLDWEGNEVLSGKLTINGTPTEPNDVARLQDVNRSFTNILNFPDALIPHGLHSNAVGWDMDKGQYLLHVICRYDSSTQGRRHMALANNPNDGTFYGSAYFTETDCAAFGAEIVTLNMMTFVSIPADNSPVYVRAYQTNTRQESINMSVRVQYYKISD